MRSISVVCGAGVATSALIAAQLSDHFAHKGADVQVRLATVMDLISPQFRTDAIVATVQIPNSIGIPVVSGMPILLGMDASLTFDELERILDLE